MTISDDTNVRASQLTNAAKHAATKRLVIEYLASMRIEDIRDLVTEIEHELNNDVLDDT